MVSPKEKKLRKSLPGAPSAVPRRPKKPESFGNLGKALDDALERRGITKQKKSQFGTSKTLSVIVAKRKKKQTNIS